MVTFHYEENTPQSVSVSPSSNLLEEAGTAFNLNSEDVCLEKKDTDCDVWIIMGDKKDEPKDGDCYRVVKIQVCVFLLLNAQPIYIPKQSG